MALVLCFTLALCCSYEMSSGDFTSSLCGGAYTPGDTSFDVFVVCIVDLDEAEPRCLILAQERKADGKVFGCFRWSLLDYTCTVACLALGGV